MILAAPLLNAVFGPEYLEGTAAFRLLLLSIGFIFINGSIRNVLLVCDRLKLEMLIMAAAAGLNIALNLVLIPRYGLVGAAFTTALAEGFILFVGALAVYKIGARLNFWPVARALLPAAMMGIGLIALGPDHRSLIVTIGLGIVIYVLAMFVFRSVPQDLWPYLHHSALFAKRLRESFRRA